MLLCVVSYVMKHLSVINWSMAIIHLFMIYMLANNKFLLSFFLKWLTEILSSNTMWTSSRQIRGFQYWYVNAVEFNLDFGLDMVGFAIIDLLLWNSCILMVCWYKWLCFVRQQLFGILNLLLFFCVCFEPLNFKM